MPKVSIIVPVYKVPEKYLRKCLDSCIAQTMKNIEIIIVHDFAEDNCGDICDEYAAKDARIKVIHKHDKTNGGLSAARNDGIAVATSDWILFVDGDDWLEENCVEYCLKHIKSADILIFSFCREYENERVKAEIFKNDKSKYEDKAVLLRRLIGPVGSEINQPHRIEDLNPAWNKLYKRKIISKIKFVDKENIGTEDLWFSILTVENSDKIVCSNESLYHYNKENYGSLTRTYDKNLFPGWKRLYVIIEDFLNSNGLCTKEYTIAISNRIVINLLPLVRNVCISSMGFKEKQRELDNILKDDIYKEAFSNFEWNELPLIWKVFFRCCKYRLTGLVWILLELGERIK